MINKILMNIWLLDELQHLIDNWQRCDTKKKHWNFEWIRNQLYHNGDHESERVADKARRLSMLYPVHELSERDIV